MEGHSETKTNEWTYIRHFSDLEEANDYMQQDWTKNYTKFNKFSGKVVYYYCKSGGKNCQKTAKLHFVHAIHLWTKECDHSHEKFAGLNQKTKDGVLEILETGISRPNQILKVLKAKGLETPEKSKLINFLQYHRTKNVDNIIHIHELNDFVAKHEEIPKEEDKFYVVKYAVEGNEFRLFFSTKRLLSLTLLGDHVCTDATYKLNYLGYPVILFGITDRDKSFHPFGISVCSGEATEDFKFGFEALKQGVHLLHPQNTYSPTILIADNAPAITCAFQQTFNLPHNFQRVNCWAHAKRAYDKRLSSVKDKDIISEIQEDIANLQLCTTEEVFLAASALFVSKWKESCNVQVSEFINYFYETWLCSNSGWYEGVAPGFPSTNNALESSNKVIKDEYTLRHRLQLGEFLSCMQKMIEDMSYQRNPDNVNCRHFADTDNDITIHLSYKTT